LVTGLENDQAKTSRFIKRAKAMNASAKGAMEPAAPIDLQFLERQSLGRQDLLREVLALFDAHAANQVSRLHAATSAGIRREVAHSILGAARGIGAHTVAEAARAVEQGGDPATEIADLDRAVTEARAFIGRYLAS
jgi:HPt (histidine-containing phosphotransfer) domain-containing protein